MDMHLKETRIGLATAIVGNPQSFDCKEEDGKFTWKLKELERHVEFFESALRKAYADDALRGCLMITIG